MALSVPSHGSLGYRQEHSGSCCGLERFSPSRVSVALDTVRTGRGHIQISKAEVLTESPQPLESAW